MFYSTGEDPISVGDWFNSNVTCATHYLEDDFSRFDATVSNWALATEWQIYEDLGLPKRISLFGQRMIHQPGQTNYGDFY